MLISIITAFSLGLFLGFTLGRKSSCVKKKESKEEYYDGFGRKQNYLHERSETVMIQRGASWLVGPTRNLVNEDEQK